MQDFMINLFGDFGRIIIFLHIVGAAFLVGSLFMIRFVIKPTLMSIENEAIRYGQCIRMLDRYFYYLFVVMILIILVSTTMSVGLGFEYANPTLYSIIHMKEAFWIFMAFNFLYMYFKLRSAKKFYKRRDFFEVHENLGLIVNWFIPLNLIMTLIASYVGIIIRGF